MGTGSSGPAGGRQRSGLCDQKCGRPGVILWGKHDEDDSLALHLCIPCLNLLTAALGRQQEQRERMINALVSQIDDIGGLAPRPSMFPPRHQVVVHGGMVFNNIDIKGSTVGAVNTGTIGQVDVAITTIRNHGDDGVAEALKGLTEGLLRADIASSLRDEALELVSVLSVEASAPPEARKRRAALRIAESLSTLLQGASAAASLWHLYGPTITAFFG